MFRVKNTALKQNRMHILEAMPVSKAIWVLALPTMVAMLIQVVYNMTDTFFIGKLNNPNMVAAISISMPIFMIIQAFGNIFAVGGASLISRLLGRGERENAKQAGAIAFWAALSMSIVVTLIGFLFRRKILMLCGATDETIGFALSYLTIMLFGSPLIGLQHALNGLLRSEGATRESMTGMIMGSILNMILDPVFIFTFNMGIAGAAVATVIGNLVGFLYFIGFYVQKKSVISISPKYFRLNWEFIQEILKIGIPATMGMMLMSLGFSLTNVVARGFGNDVIAANGVVMRITNIAVMLTIGLAQGCQPLMGYSYGAKKYQRLLATVKRAITIGTIMDTVFAVLFFLLADFWIKVFIVDPAVIDYGSRIIRAFTVAMPFLGMQMVLMNMFQALGKSIESLTVSLGRQGLFYIPALFIFSSLWGFDGFKFAMPFGDIATTCLAFVLFWRMQKKFTFTEKELPGGQARTVLDSQN